MTQHCHDEIEPTELLDALVERERSR